VGCWRRCQDRAPDPGADGAYPALVRRAEGFMQANFDRAITLDEQAQQRRLHRGGQARVGAGQPG